MERRQFNKFKNVRFNNTSLLAPKIVVKVPTQNNNETFNTNIVIQFVIFVKSLRFLTSKKILASFWNNKTPRIYAGNLKASHYLTTTIAWLL